MVDALTPPRRKNPLKRMRIAGAPPSARSRAALFFTSYAARGVLALQRCEACGEIAYPPRDICGKCWSDELAWRETPGGGRILAETTIRASTNVYFKERAPWRIATVKLDAGPVIVAHLHADARNGELVRVIARTDKSGQGVLIALPAAATANMADDKELREMTCDPKHRRVLVTDVRTPMGQAVAKAVVAAGAAKVYLGVAGAWKPFIGQDNVYALAGAEIAPLDLADTESVAELAKSIGGAVDILINTAQFVRPGSMLARRDIAVAREEMEINYFGAARLLQAFGPAMRARSADGVNSAAAWVNCLSVFAVSNWARFGATSASQAAALSLAQNARAEFAGSGVKIVNVFHGPIDDEWAQSLPPPKVSPVRFAADVVDGLKQGLEDIYVGEVARDIYDRWSDNPAVFEREMTLAKIMD